MIDRIGDSEDQPLKGFGRQQRTREGSMLNLPAKTYAAPVYNLKVRVISAYKEDTSGFIQPGKPWHDVQNQ